MGVPAHFSHIMVPDTSAKSRVQNTSAKLEISWKLYAGKFFWKLYARKLFGNYMLRNFLETICWEISLKLYDGNFLELYAGKFGWMPAAFEEVIMAQCYSIILQFSPPKVLEPSTFAFLLVCHLSMKLFQGYLSLVLPDCTLNTTQLISTRRWHQTMASVNSTRHLIDAFSSL